ncbi:hypothetical protein [Allorhizobium taibaishanense]|uniref:Uncharacterized protein n=1 Tax=Allorhizobium taibaishanense TaxID=887144 RepID=A0A1Q9A494_9HYPH|nr:hypothetical protein [Allorhizobium taibaishanense]MBB4006343.1 hypothetical protein [Allorhizobium taibaishanense]OLP49297.1 hypothetical protein BJF91_19780 [Allorhizobium taibaishanense]
MTGKLPPPPLDGLKRQIDRHRRRQDKASLNTAPSGSGAFVRETFRLDREAAREKAREWFDTYPKAAYWTEVESWRQLDGDAIEFTMRRLSSAD